MRIRKAFQGTIPDNKILDTYSTSQTDTYSCNYTNNVVGWKLLGSTTGTTKLALPTTYNEIMLVGNYQTNSNTIIVPKVYMDTLTAEHMFSSGWYQSGSFGGRFAFNTLNNEVWLSIVYINSSDVTSSSKMYVYYR